MADEGKFEPGYEGDVMPSVPVLGAGSISPDGDALRVQVGEDGPPRADPPPNGKKKRTQPRELAYAWTDVLAVTNDARDPRVILIVVRHEGEPRVLRFRPALPTPALLSDLQWMAANAFVDEEEDEDADLEEVRARLAEQGVTFEIAQGCTGPGCKPCEHLQAMQQHHARARS